MLTNTIRLNFERKQAREQQKAAMTAVWSDWGRIYEKLDFPPWEIMEWLRDFRIALNSRETCQAHIAGGGLPVYLDTNCDCSMNQLQGQDDPLRWVHENHRDYNKTLKELITKYLGMETFKEILLEDLKTTSGPSDMNPECGKLLCKDYTRKLINNFIDTDNWC